MNKKNNRKGFTIVELVIVIAVIAVLATVLVPTFGTIIEKANTSKALQEGKNIYTNYVANVDYAGGKTAEPNIYVVVGDYYVTIANGSATAASKTAPTAPYKTLTATTANGVTTYNVADVTTGG
jgi:type IV pilus assembly protein PilA